MVNISHFWLLSSLFTYREELHVVFLFIQSSNLKLPQDMPSLDMQPLLNWKDWGMVPYLVPFQVCRTITSHTILAAWIVTGLCGWPFITVSTAPCCMFSVTAAPGHDYGDAEPDAGKSLWHLLKLTWPTWLPVSPTAKGPHLAKLLVIITSDFVSIFRGPPMPCPCHTNW